MIEFLQNNYVALLVALLALSEVLALIPSVKSNSVFTLVYNLLKSLAKKDEEPK